MKSGPYITNRMEIVIPRGSIPVYKHYKNKKRPQPAYIEIDCIAHSINVCYKEKTEIQASHSIHRKQIFRIRIPCRIKQEILIEKLISHKSRILFETIFNGFKEIFHNKKGYYYGQLSNNAVEAITKLKVFFNETT